MGDTCDIGSIDSKYIISHHQPGLLSCSIWKTEPPWMRSASAGTQSGHRHSLVSTSVTTMGLENWILKPQGYSPVPLLIFTVLSRTTEKGEQWRTNSTYRNVGVVPQQDAQIWDGPGSGLT